MSGELFRPGLYLASSPLGNLGDLTPRLGQALAAAQLVAAEDTRRTLKLLTHLGLKKPLVSYREENHARSWPKLTEALSRGEIVVLLTDAGAPGISDPGAMLVRAARAAGYPVIPLPGPSAVICALTASGFSADRFTFAGFLPARATERRRFLEKMASVPVTLVFFEAPHRLAASLADLAKILGPRPAFLAREMTKLHEEYLAAPLDQLAREAAERPRKGEITLVVAGASDERPEPLAEERLRDLVRNDPRSPGQLAKDLARLDNRPRAELYRLILHFRKSADG